LKFFDFIIRNKFSVSITLLIHLIVFIVTNSQVIELGVISHESELETVAIMDFSEQPQDDKIPANPNEAPIPNSVISNIQNVAADQNQEKTTYTNTFSKSDADQAVMDELKGMEAAEFAKLQQDNPELINISENPERDVNPNLVKTDANKNDKAGYGKEVSATADYSVTNRKHLTKKIPSYVCINQGTVTVDIKVNQKGEVISQSIDESKTNTDNLCLRDNSLEYARKWKFNQDFNGPLRSSGWIQFTFIKQ
jgi:outer membrane biosynthesis protein TonB